jgi:hypothetical protein
LLRRPQGCDRRRWRDALVTETGEQRFGFAMHRRPIEDRTSFVFVTEKDVECDRKVRDEVELLIDGGDATGD